MGYIGKIPSAVPLTSADITDNVITSAKIVDGTITNTDIASSIITGQTAETSIAGGDSILIYDDSATALRKMTRTNFVAGLSVDNTPAFEAKLSANQNISNDTSTKVQIDSEIFDTNNCYDSTTNYRFTPNVAGKYYVYASVNIYNTSSNQQLIWGEAEIRKNGTSYRSIRDNPGSSGANANATANHVHAVVDMNGSTDYLEFFAKANVATNAPQLINANTTDCTYFGAYKLIGV